MRLLLSSLISLWLFVSVAQADSVLVIHQNYGGAQSNIGSQLTSEGHTVTYSTSTTLPSITGYAQIWDVRYEYGYSASEVTALSNFVQNGGFLMMNGENSGFATRNNAIASVVSAAGGGTLTFGSGSNSYTVINSTFTNDTGTVTGAAGSSLTNSQGQYVFKTSSGVIGAMIWQSADLGSGYSGAVFVTADINMWDSTYGSTLLKVNITDDILDMETAGTLYGSSAPQAGITTSQQTTVDTTRSKTQAGNKIYMTQSGSGIDLDILQDGDDNLIIGTDLTSAANITGDSIELTITQKNNDNVLGIDINGNSNDVDVWQDTGQRAIVDITGASNTLDLEQLHLSNSGEHFARVEVNGDSNSLTIDQKETGDKILFLDVDGGNTVDIDQLGTGDHFLDVTLTDNHTLTVTQDGSGSHDALIDLSGNPTTLDLTQDSAADQNYHLQQSCATATCSVTVTQN